MNEQFFFFYKDIAEFVHSIGLHILIIAHPCAELVLSNTNIGFTVYTVGYYIQYDTLRSHSMFSAVFTLGYSEGTFTQCFYKLSIYKNEVMWFPTLFYYSTLFPPLPPVSVCWNRK